MSMIAILDAVAFITLIMAFLILLFRKRRVRGTDIFILVCGLIFAVAAYVFFMFLEWINISHELESVENLVGAAVPIMWAFLIYSFIQHGINEDLDMNKENLRITLNSIGDAVIATDVKGRITRMNPAAEVLTGWKLSEALERKIDEVLILIDSVNRKKITNPVTKALETGKLIDLGLQTILVGKNHKEFHISDTTAPIFNDNQEICGAVLVFSDMTEMFDQEAKIHESEERFNLAMSATRAGLWDWFLSTDKVILNERWAEIIGYTLQELEPITPNTWQKRMHPEDLIELEELIEAHIKGKIDYIEHESRLKHKNGEWIWIKARGKIFNRDKQGNPVRMTGTMVDITNQKITESALKAQIEENKNLNSVYAAQNLELSESIERIRKINEELSEAKLNAEESYRLKSAFLANMSHEIRTPMNGIIGFSELLRDSHLTEERRSYYANIVIDSCHQLLAIVNDILDISRIETGRISLSSDRVVVNDMLDILHAFFEPQVGNKSLELIVVKPLSKSESTIMTDKIRLRQVLTNLLNNAIKFTESGQITLGYKLVEGYFEFFVADTGIGIHPALHEKIFEPFRQADLEITNRYGGTGLGLTISRRLVEYLGGSIWLTSEPGKGSIFYFTLPYIPERSTYTRKAEKEELISNKFYNMVILIVEDDEVNFMFLETVLSKSNIKTIRAMNGMEAVEICQSNSDIDLVLMDIKMPIMNGYEATRKIKKIRPDLPIIAQTAYAMQEDRNKALEAGCDGYISKPILTTELLKLIDNLGGKNKV